MKQFLPIVLVLLIVAFATGCGAAYRLQGKVIPGNISYVTVVHGSDERLDQPGLAGVTVRLISEPDKLNREVMGEAVTDSNGKFSIPFEKIGAGMMLYNVGLSARRDGYAPAVSTAFRLPPESRRVLILLVPGQDTYRDPIDDTPGAILNKMRR